ncbi:MAG: DUF4912 domain-containing protein [Spirochaetales bacterium]|nr:DUF4912 domain-containing protein [Spirochaetales bacterium]
MVLLNIDALSTSELQYIARQEKLDDWEELSREELIDAIKDIYDALPEEGTEYSTQKGLHKFCNCLTDAQFTKMMSLPGVEALPDQYLYTTIQMIIKDPYWAYAFWSISPNTRSECRNTDPDYSVFLKVIATDRATGKDETFEITVSDMDKSWSIALPWMGRDYKTQLVALYPSTGTEEILAVSGTVSTPDNFDPKVIEKVRGGLQAGLVLTMASSRNGEMMDNKLVKELFEQLNGEGR